MAALQLQYPITNRHLTNRHPEQSERIRALLMMAMPIVQTTTWIPRFARDDRRALVGTIS